MEDIYIYKRIPAPNGSDPTDSLEEFEKYTYLNRLFLKTAPSILLIFGVPGNIITIMVLSRRTMKDNVFSGYLISMCVFNIITLFIAMSRHISAGFTGVELMTYNPATCRLVRFSTFFLMSLTSWHLVLITGCRVLYLINSRTRQFTGCVHPYLAIAVCVGICALLELVVTFQGLIFTNKKGAVVACYLPNNSPWIYIQFFIYAIGPAIFLIVFNAMIILMHLGEGSGLQTSQLTNKVRHQLVILVFVSSVQFIITVFPVGFFYGLLNKMFDMNTRSGEVKGQLAYNATVILFYCNNATNFIIYCFFWQRFRIELFKIFSAISLDYAVSDMEFKFDHQFSHATGSDDEAKSNAALSRPHSHPQTDYTPLDYSLATSSSLELDPAPRNSMYTADSRKKNSFAQNRKDSMHKDSLRQSGRKESVRVESVGQYPRDRRDSTAAASSVEKLHPVGGEISASTVNSASRSKSVSRTTSAREVTRSSQHTYTSDKFTFKS
ncbi:hypothetical protein Btru_071561 [Bulinus truncatus]|nr:hypothetical protein Btru_071561 [Bulinus truncatus]